MNIPSFIHHVIHNNLYNLFSFTLEICIQITTMSTYKFSILSWKNVFSVFLVQRAYFKDDRKDKLLQQWNMFQKMDNWPYPLNWISSMWKYNTEHCCMDGKLVRTGKYTTIFSILHMERCLHHQDLNFVPLSFKVLIFFYLFLCDFEITYEASQLHKIQV